MSTYTELIEAINNKYDTNIIKNLLYKKDDIGLTLLHGASINNIKIVKYIFKSKG